MMEEPNNLIQNNLPIDQDSATSEFAEPLANSINNFGQELEAKNEPDDIFGDIDSLNSEVSTIQEPSVKPVRESLSMQGNKGFSILLKLLVVVITLAVLAAVVVLAYPYIQSMISSKEDTVISEPVEIIVEDSYDFFNLETVDYDDAEEIVDVEENMDDDFLIFSDDMDIYEEDDLMVEPDRSLTEIISGQNSVNENDIVNDEVKEKVVDLDKDTDNDGLTDEEEEKLGTHKMKADTDNDGLSDRDEVMIYKTNPLEYDTDGDGLSDYDEIFVYKTDPLLADTDGDGYPDGEEVHNGYDPNGQGILSN